MSDEQVGQYIRLMCIQANKGYITKKDMLNVCKTHDEDIANKFNSISEDKFCNAFLSEVIEQRKAFTESRRNNRKGVKDTSETDMSNISLSSVERMVNVNKDINVNKEKEEEGGAGGNFLIPQMCSVWYESFPTYTKDQQRDYQSMFRIMHFMGQQAGVSNLAQHPEHFETAIDTLKQIVTVIQQDTFWVNKPLSSISNSIQEFYNKIKNPQHEQRNSKTRKQTGSNLREELQAKLDERFAGK